ncbi:MAG: hypothetical protein RLZ54_211 [Candidatus Parcubacteria bacterium]
MFIKNEFVRELLWGSRMDLFINVFHNQINFSMEKLTTLLMVVATIFATTLSAQKSDSTAFFAARITTFATDGRPGVTAEVSALQPIASLENDLGIMFRGGIGFDGKFLFDGGARVVLFPLDRVSPYLEGAGWWKSKDNGGSGGYFAIGASMKLKGNIFFDGAFTFTLSETPRPGIAATVGYRF